MGYKTINLRTQVLKGSVTPSKVFEEQRNQQRQQKKLQQQQKHARNDIGCCERLNVNLHRWLETKFSMCPVSCFPFKLGDSKSSSSNKNNKRSSVESVQPGKQQRKESNEKPIYVDCSDLYLWEYDTDIISLNKHHHSAVIDRDVNNSFKFIPSKTTSSNKTHEHHHYNHHNHHNPHKQAQVTPNKQSTSKRKREHQQQKQQRMNKSPSIKAKFEKRLGRMKKMSDENRISENDGDERTMASREKMKKESVVSAMSTRSKDSVVTFSSIFGDASLFDTDEARIEEESENSSYHIVDETDLENPIESIHSSENDRFEVIHDKDDTDEMFEEHVELKIEREYEDQEADESQLDHRRRCCESTNFQSQEEQDHYEDDFEDDEDEEGFEEEGEIYQFSDDTETSSSEISQTEYF